jgi:hypothetical protein
MVDFTYSTFSNVKFIRGSFAGKKWKDIYGYEYETSLEGVSIDRVLFDGVYFDISVSLGLHGGEDGGGVVVMRNITTSAKNTEPGSLLSGSNLHIRMDNCQVTNQGVLLLTGENNSAYITNSRFVRTPGSKNSAGMRFNDDGKTAWIENSVLQGSSTPGAKKVVITNCVLGDVDIDHGGDNSVVFLSKNTYKPQTDKDYLRIFLSPKRIYETAHLYLYADGAPIPHADVIIDTGNVNIYDTEINRLNVGSHQRFETALSSLNLSNVSIKSGFFKETDLRQGKWQNVRIGKPVDLNKAKIGTITGHNVTFPQGVPWVNGTLEIVNSPTPLEFDKPPVPTLEDLGLAQFWKENDFPVENY